MEDREVKRKENLHKISKCIQLFTISPIMFCVINVFMHYLLLMLGNVKSPNAECDWTFKAEYIYTESRLMPIRTVILVAFIFAILIVMRLDEIWRVKHGAENLKSDDRFMTQREIAKSFDKVKLNELEKAANGGVMLAQKGKTAYIDTEDIHTLLIGATRSGKGESVILPLIRIISSVKNKESFITNDMKSDNLEKTYSILTENGYRIYVINLDDAVRSEEWDMLYEAKREYVKVAGNDEPDLSNCMKIIDSIASLFTDDPKSEPVWPNSAHALLVAMILYMMEEGYKNRNLHKVTMPSVYHFFITYGSHSEIINDVKVNALDAIFQSLPVGNPAKASYASSKFAEGEMRSSIFSLLTSDLKVFASDMGVQKITSGNTIDFSKIVTDDKPCAVFLILPDEDRSRDIIASAFVNQCYDYLVKQSKKYPRKMLPRRVRIILDEFANMPRIPSMDNKISIGAGHNILFALAIQDLNQLDDKYGSKAKSIRGNCGNVMYINSIDNDTNKYISAIMGSKQYDITSYSGSLHEWIKHKNIAHETKPLMSATQLGRMKKGKAVTVRQRSYPIMAKFKPFYKYNFPVTQIEDIPLHKITRKMRDSFYPIEDFQKAIGMCVVGEREQSAGSNYETIDTGEEETVFITTEVQSDNSLRELMDKLNENSNGRFKEEVHSGNIKRAEELAKLQFKIKKISKEELDIILSELSQYY